MSNKILLVDDDPNLLSTVEKFFCRVKAFWSPALKMLKKLSISSMRLPKSQSNFDLLIFDVLMPGKNGLELAKSIRAQGLKTPLIFITGVFKNQANQSTAMRKLRAHALSLSPLTAKSYWLP